jgi:type 1 fimbria pilin
VDLKQLLFRIGVVNTIVATLAVGILSSDSQLLILPQTETKQKPLNDLSGSSPGSLAQAYQAFLVVAAASNSLIPSLNACGVICFL